MTFLDQTRDANGQHLCGLLNTVGADGVKLFHQPDFVKAATADQVTGGADAAPGVYGHPPSRSFPCHTAPATWVSALFFHSQKHAAAPRLAAQVESRIDAAARHHGIGAFVDHVKAAAAAARAADDTARPDADFAVVVRYGDVTERHLPIRNPGELKVASEYLKTHAAAFPYEDRRRAADKILTKAAALGASLADADDLARRAGRGATSPQVAADLVFKRAQAVRQLHRDDPAHLGVAEQLAKIAASCLTHHGVATSPDRLRKLAALLDGVDREYKLGGLTDLPPVEDLFGVTEKVARDVYDSHMALTTGTVYARADLDRVGVEDVRAVMGDGFADAVAPGGLFLDREKFAAVAATLPRPDAALLDRVLAAAGVGPVYKDAAPARV